VVGTLLSAVNQGHLIAGGDADLVTWIRVGVNYLVPYTVASIGFLSARRIRGGDEQRTNDQPGSTGERSDHGEAD
jgi:hypothetical protein